MKFYSDKDMYEKKLNIIKPTFGHNIIIMQNYFNINTNFEENNVSKNFITNSFLE
jgi:hypothetical protein